MTRGGHTLPDGRLVTFSALVDNPGHLVCGDIQVDGAPVLTGLLSVTRVPVLHADPNGVVVRTFNVNGEVIVVRYRPIGRPELVALLATGIL